MITKEDITKLCELSRIDISEEEVVSLQKDIEGILGYVGQIKEAKINEVRQVYSSNKNTLREDKVLNEPDLFTEDLINLAPKKEKRFFKTKKIL